MKLDYIFGFASGFVGIWLINESRTFMVIYRLPGGDVHMLLRAAASTSLWALPKHPCFGSSQLHLH
ncbi:hypothetical protein [Shewanella violacea]|uniref:hypothetical protein n=1 Tax=Shewanella violacea TaxID=60217 RepID=UPI0002D7174E|nr:hypothetical protein [Shewanella violacea]